MSIKFVFIGYIHHTDHCYDNECMFGYDHFLTDDERIYKNIREYLEDHVCSIFYNRKEEFIKDVKRMIESNDHGIHKEFDDKYHDGYHSIEVSIINL